MSKKNKAAKRGHIDLRMRYLVLQRSKFCCVYCGAPAGVKTLHIDHVIPVARGGRTEMSNLVAACVDCNQGKKDLQPHPRVANQEEHDDLIVWAKMAESIWSMAFEPLELTDGVHNLIWQGVLNCGFAHVLDAITEASNENIRRKTEGASPMSRNAIVLSMHTYILARTEPELTR